MTEPQTIYLDVRADIEPTRDGIALVSPQMRVELTEQLANRLAINVFAARRREGATS